MQRSFWLTFLGRLSVVFRQVLRVKFHIMIAVSVRRY